MKDWKLDTTLKWKRHKDVNSLIFKASDWCSENINSLIDKEFPAVWIVRDRANSCGEYCWTDNIITIYPKNNKTVEDVVDTVIHEWIHWSQDGADLEMYKYDNGLDPKENDAIENARIMTPMCWRNLCNYE